MNDRPLSGRRVIEFGTMVAALYATHILSQFGAEVIKVEPPTGDTTRNRDCQEFRVRSGIMGKKEPHYVTTQRTDDTG